MCQRGGECSSTGDPYLKNALFWKWFKPHRLPEVLLDNSGHKFKIKSGRPIGLNDEKPGFSPWAFY